jgi:hypothetical protein
MAAILKLGSKYKIKLEGEDSSLCAEGTIREFNITMSYDNCTIQSQFGEERFINDPIYDLHFTCNHFTFTKFLESSFKYELLIYGIRDEVSNNIIL